MRPKHEAFAQKVAAGSSAGEAYREVYTTASKATAETEGPKLLRNPQIALRVEELKAAQRAALTEDFKVSRGEVIHYLLEVMNTPVGHIDPNHRLCQEWTEEKIQMGEAVKTRTKVKMPPKLEAVEKIIKMAGWYSPEKVQIGADAELKESLLALLDSIRK